MQVEDAIVVHSKSGENASEPEYVPTEAEKISGDIAIDALPYIDTEYNDPATKKRVNDLIISEMRTFIPPDYLAHLPTCDMKFGGSTALQKEYERVRHGRKSAPALDIKRYRLDPPEQALHTNLNAWRSSLNNAHAQLEHQHNRILNLELLSKFGSTQWVEHNKDLKAFFDSLPGKIQEVKNQIDEVNRLRKQEQLAVAPKLTMRKRKVWESIRKNQQIESQCNLVEREIKRLRSALDQSKSKKSTSSKT